MDCVDKALEEFRNDKNYRRRDGDWVRVNWMRTNNPLKDPEASIKRVNSYNWESASLKYRSLSESEVLSMKKLYSEDLTLSAKDLGVKYGISTLNVIQYLSNKKKVNYGESLEIRKSLTKKCPYCKEDVIGAGLGNYHRWHGDNCKLAPGYIKLEYRALDHYPKWIELTSGFTGSVHEMLERFPYLNVPSMMNSNSKNKPLEKGKNKGLHFNLITKI